MPNKSGILLLLALMGLLVLSSTQNAVADPDIYLKRSQASGITTSPGLLMAFSSPGAEQPASLTTAGDVEYYWYSEPYFGTIPGPKPHAFHLYYTADSPVTITVTVFIAVQADGSGVPGLVSGKSYQLEVTQSVRRVTIPDVVTIPQITLNGERIKLSLSTDQPVTIYFDGAAAPSVLNSIPPPTTPIPPPPYTPKSPEEDIVTVQAYITPGTPNTLHLTLTFAAPTPPSGKSLLVLATRLVGSTEKVIYEYIYSGAGKTVHSFDVSLVDGGDVDIALYAMVGIPATERAPDTGFYRITSLSAGAPNYFSDREGVGGVVLPTNTLMSLAPYLAVIGVVATAAIAIKRRRDD